MRTSSPCYIAAPFFNYAQNNLLDKVESLFDSVGAYYFSPRKDADVVPAGAPMDEWQNAFDQNVRAIHVAEWMLAVLTYELPEGLIATIVPKVVATPPDNLSPINIPDIGTVWEMGMAYAMNKPVVGYLPNKEALGTVNVMLARSMATIVIGINELMDTLHGNPPRRTVESENMI